MRIKAEVWEELSSENAEEATKTRKTPHFKIRDFSEPFN